MSKPCKVYMLDGIQSLHYILGMVPAIYHKSHEVHTNSNGNNTQSTSYMDTNWRRDQHAILVKKRNDIKGAKKREIIKTYKELLSFDQAGQLLQICKKRLTTLNEKSQLIKNFEMRQLRPANQKAIVEYSLEWFFSKWIQGPLAITRTLSQESMSCTSLEVMDPFQHQLHKENKYKSDNFEIGHLTTLDYKYFLIHQQTANDIDFPLDIDCEFIEVTDDNITNKEECVILSEIETKHLEESYESDDPDYEYNLCLTQQGNDVFLKLHHGSSVFEDVNKEINIIFQSHRFQQWANERWINLEPWVGYGDFDKIDDHRRLKSKALELFNDGEHLKEQNEKLLQDNIKLQKENSRLLGLINDQ